jgi:hypothetical protein
VAVAMTKRKGEFNDHLPWLAPSLQAPALPYPLLLRPVARAEYFEVSALAILLLLSAIYETVQFDLLSATEPMHVCLVFCGRGSSATCGRCTAALAKVSKLVLQRLVE